MCIMTCSTSGMMGPLAPFPASALAAPQRCPSAGTRSTLPGARQCCSSTPWRRWGLSWCGPWSAPVPPCWTLLHAPHCLMAARCWPFMTALSRLAAVTACGWWQACRLNFSEYRLMPMGSYPRISDRRVTLDLFGPVNRLYCTSYDKAATYFLACLKVRRFCQPRGRGPRSPRPSPSGCPSRDAVWRQPCRTLQLIHISFACTCYVPLPVLMLMLVSGQCIEAWLGKVGACIAAQEFSEVARARDVSEGRTPFELPYAIEADCVGGHTIKLQSPFRRDTQWTKALKYMLTDLKWALTWMISQQDSVPGPPIAPTGQG